MFAQVGPSHPNHPEDGRDGQGELVVGQAGKGKTPTANNQRLPKETPTAPCLARTSSFRGMEGFQAEIPREKSPLWKLYRRYPSLPGPSHPGGFPCLGAGKPGWSRREGALPVGMEAAAPEGPFTFYLLLSFKTLNFKFSALWYYTLLINNALVILVLLINIGSFIYSFRLNAMCSRVRVC